jgi:hypothetical protein
VLASSPQAAFLAGSRLTPARRLSSAAQAQGRTLSQANQACQQTQQQIQQVRRRDAEQRHAHAATLARKWALPALGVTAPRRACAPLPPRAAPRRAVRHLRDRASGARAARQRSGARASRGLGAALCTRTPHETARRWSFF